MRPEDLRLTIELRDKLISFQQIHRMPGITSPESLDCLIKQMIDSVRRIRYVSVIKNKTHDISVCNPYSIAFDPIKAAAWHHQKGNIDEAAWLIFLSTHFGKNGRTGWRLVGNVYGSLGQKPIWTWPTIKTNVANFRNWLHQNERAVKLNANFGNHRKYESINALQNNGTGEAISTYVNLIHNGGGHIKLFSDALADCNNDKRATFAKLYNTLSSVNRFGRTARFDYLTMVGKLKLIDIEPNSTYMHGATGPYLGASLLFGSHQSKNTFNQWLDELDAHLNLYFGMQVLEDSLCNWQKSPNKYLYFKG